MKEHFKGLKNLKLKECSFSVNLRGVCLFSKRVRLNIFAFSFAIGVSFVQAEESNPNTCCFGKPPTYELDLEGAVNRALSHSEKLHTANHELQSKGYQARQARLYPNPVFSYEVENFAGSNDWDGWNSREERYIWSQLWETAGKRSLRTQAATHQYYASLVGYDVSKLILLNRLYRAFIQVAAAQELLALSQDLRETAGEVLRVATKKVEAGKVSIMQQNKGEVAFSTALIQLERAQAELKNAKKRLSLLWAAPCPDFEKVTFPLYDIFPPISLDECVSDLCNQAEIVQSHHHTCRAEKAWHLEKAGKVPDVILEVGYKANYEEDNQSLIAGISFPIPLFNRNEGNIGRAYYDMLKIENEGRELRLVLESKLAIIHEELTSSYRVAERFKNYSLPAAEKSFKMARRGYRKGKFEYLDVLDSQRTLFEVKASYIQALVNYHTKRADIDFLNSQMD